MPKFQFPKNCKLVPYTVPVITITLWKHQKRAWSNLSGFNPETWNSIHGIPKLEIGIHRIPKHIFIHYSQTSSYPCYTTWTKYYGIKLDNSCWVFCYCPPGAELSGCPPGAELSGCPPGAELSGCPPGAELSGWSRVKIRKVTLYWFC